MSLFNKDARENQLGASLAEMAIQVKPSGGDDTAAINASLNSLTNGGKLLLSGTFNVSDTIVVSNPNTIIELARKSKIIFSQSDRNCITLNGANCSIIGNGTIQSPAVWVPKDSGFFWEYAVVFIASDGCSVKDVTLYNVPRVGVGIHEVSNVIVENVKVKGNMPSDSSQTGHFGITFDPGSTYPNGNITITNCFVSGMKEGIEVANWGAGSGYGLNISNNIIQECYDHAIYVGPGASNVIFNDNTIVDCSNPIAITGSNHNVQGNNIYSLGSTLVTTFGTAISARDVKGCVISGNNIRYNPAASTSVIILTQLSGSEVSNNIVSDNFIDCGTNSVIAIRVTNGATTPILNNNIVSGNVIKGKALTGFGLISLSTGGGAYGLRNKIIGNIITVIDSDNTGNAIWTYYQKYSDVISNTIDFMFNASSAITTRGMRIEQTLVSSIKNNIMTCLTGYGSNVTAVGINEASSSDKNIIDTNDIQFSSTNLVSSIPLSFLSKTTRRNRISEDDMSGTVTITSGATYATVTNRNVSTTSRVLVTPSNTEAGAKGFYVTMFNGYFNLSTATGAATAANATYFWEIA